MTAVIVTQGLLDLLRERRFAHAAWRGDRLKVGERISVPEDCRLEPHAQMFFGYLLPASMGAFTYSHSQLDGRLEIGRYGSIGSGVTWIGDPHPLDWASTSPFSYGAGPLQGVMTYFRDHVRGDAANQWTFSPPDQRIRLGHDVWIGDQASIGPGVSIGDGAVIGARSLILEDVPPYAVMVGAPARVLRMRFPEALVERLRALAWWRYGPDLLVELPVPQPERFIEALEARIAAGGVQPFAPQPITHDEILAVAEPMR
ncbi:CatB-related O-acetyltransferase [Phenylobacterium soli]|uniref:Antibiotic acetyltransferase n=1 Tax=Phenylobacterium soli TaxID=2170551 RepID=A0A328AM30_9CAUL|nr:CatB-related O-acetyltransferase [Phenylobacterium soli]RAK55607.1 antibiotic acetyltransferase [Phenylobacterium soli]